MKIFSFFALLAVLAVSVVAWEKEDHEIFDLVSAVETFEGKGMTFYSWLDVSPTATTAEIAKAYRKMSMRLHPDKNSQVKGIHERFARLGVVSTILRNAESRKRYDFFYKNGVPKWRGTGYYYSRFRPGLGSVCAFLVFVTSIVQYTVQKLNYRRDLKRVEMIASKACLAAWGVKGTPGVGQRKVKVNLGTPQEEGGSNENRWCDMVVEGTNVYLLESNGEMHILDASTAVKPAVTNTWLIALCLFFFHRIRPGKGGAPRKDMLHMDAPTQDNEDDESETGTEPASASSHNEDRKAVIKSGVRRKRRGGKKQKEQAGRVGIVI